MLGKKTIKKLQLEQKKLDEFIWKNYLKRNKITTYDKESLFVKSKVALLVEVGELANELKTFKHWKAHKVVDWEKVKEELIDCLHFYLSWANEYQIDFSDYKVKDLFKESDYNELLLGLFSETNLFDLEILKYNKPNFLERIKIEKNKENFYRWLSIFEEICRKLEMNEKDVEKAYMIKNKINWDRQKQSY